MLKQAEGLKKISRLLDLAIVDFPVSGGIVNSTIPLRLEGCDARVLGCSPDGKTFPIEFSRQTAVLHLRQPGLYQITAEMTSGRRHVSRVICHPEWESLYDRVNHFYRDHFQHPTGAFAHAISRDSLKPDRINLGGVALRGSVGARFLHDGRIRRIFRVCDDHEHAAVRA